MKRVSYTAGYALPNLLVFAGGIWLATWLHIDLAVYLIGYTVARIVLEGWRKSKEDEILRAALSELES